VCRVVDTGLIVLCAELSALSASSVLWAMADVCTRASVAAHTHSGWRQDRECAKWTDGRMDGCGSDVSTNSQHASDYICALCYISQPRLCPHPSYVI